MESDEMLVNDVLQERSSSIFNKPRVHDFLNNFEPNLQFENVIPQFIDLEISPEGITTK